MGWMNMFKNMSKTVDAHAQKVADKLEDDNAVEFANQDIVKMKKDRDTVLGNIGKVKGEIAVLKDKIKDTQTRIKKHQDDAIALGESDEELAIKHITAYETLERQLEPLKISLQTQENLLTEQVSTKNDLQSALDQSEAELGTLKAMTDAAHANEKLASVSSDSGTSALASFKSKQEKAKKRLIASQEIKAGSSGDDLEKKTREALGGGGKAKLEALMAAKKKKK